MRKSDITLIISTLSSFWNSSLNQLLKIMFTLINSIWNVLSMLRSQSIIGNLFSCFIFFLFFFNFFFIFFMLIFKKTLPATRKQFFYIDIKSVCLFSFHLGIELLFYFFFFGVKNCNKKSIVISHVQRAYWKYSTFHQ